MCSDIVSGGREVVDGSEVNGKYERVDFESQVWWEPEDYVVDC